MNQAQADLVQTSRVACIIDLDNILNRGFDKRTRSRRPQAQLDMSRLHAALSARGVARGTACRNWEFSHFARQMWTALGFNAVATRANCDPKVIAEMNAYVAAGVDSIILVAGDSDYCEAVASLRAMGIRVEIWARRASASRELINLADRVQWVDRFLSASETKLPAVPAQERPAIAAKESPIASNDNVEEEFKAPQFGLRRGRKISIDHQCSVSGAAM